VVLRGMGLLSAISTPEGTIRAKRPSPCISQGVPYKGYTQV
jgi:hypothetical protein